MEIIDKIFNESELNSAFMLGVNLQNNRKLTKSYNYSSDGNDIFRIASMTKVITTVAALQQVESGLIGINEPLNNIVPELADVPCINKEGSMTRPNADITMKHLITHTAGFGYFFTSDELENYLGKAPFGKDLIQHQMSLRLFEPGESFRYGTNIDWLGKAVETLSGKNLEQYFRDHITGPLGMDSTWFIPPEHLKHRIVNYYHKDKDTYTLAGERIPKISNFFSGGGGLLSSPNDYLKFLTCLVNGGKNEDFLMLQEQTVRSMYEDQLEKNIDIKFPKISFNHPWIGKGNFISDLEGCRWGYGWALETRNNDYLRPKGTAFWAGLYNSYFTIDPLKQVIVLYFSQFFPFNDKYAYSMYRNFENEVYKL